MRVVISPLAERDLEAIGDYIADDNRPRALSFVAELRTLCAKIAKAPQAYRARPELGEGKAKYRACPARRDGHCSAIQERAGITAP